MPNSNLRHLPVLVDEAISLLKPVLAPGKIAIDCTVGAGGHTERLLATGAEVIGMDRDEEAISAARERFATEPRLKLVHGDFRDIEHVVREAGRETVDVVLADLGVSSPQLDEPSRGFSFRAPGPLDMRMDPSSGAPLMTRLQGVDEATLTRVIRDLGEERAARPIARAILNALREGTLTDTASLAETVSRASHPSTRRGKKRIHPATRTFQALRIWVNEELSALDSLLGALPRLLAKGGRAAIISFHSLEDRRVKQSFSELSTGCVCPVDLPVCSCGQRPVLRRVTRRVVRPTKDEQERNPRARSARLRVVEKIDSCLLLASNDDEEKWAHPAHEVVEPPHQAREEDEDE